MKQIGLITGGGTGTELGEFFKKVCNSFAEKYNLNLSILEWPHKFKSFHDVRTLDEKDIRKKVEEDFNQLLDAYEFFYDKGCRAIFRTAINAETLYSARMKMKGIKVVPIQIGNYTLLMIRDLMQGFYSNDNTSFKDEEIEFKGTFAKSNINIITAFLKEHFASEINDDTPLWFLYKHHLFGATIEKWIKKDINKALVYQPDTGIDKLFKHIENPASNLIFVTSNEIGDIIHEALVLHLKQGNKNTLYTKNVFLENNFAGLYEYQTVHGSVDDLASSGKVNPTAMIRAAGAIIDQHFEIKIAENLVECVLQKIHKEKILTPDEGGGFSTNEVIDAFLNHLNKTAI